MSATKERHRLSGARLAVLYREWAPYLALVALLLLLGFVLHPPGVLVTLGNPQQVLTSNPKAAVHTRLIDEVEAWKIQRTLAMAREMGAAWIVEYFPWAYVENTPGRFDWNQSDLIIAHAQNQGLTVIARLGMTPAWARPNPDDLETTFTYLDEAHYADFARYVGAFAARYRDSVRHIVIWNEPNLTSEWGFRPVDPEGYVALLRVAYQAAHEVNPDIVVLGGALAPTLMPEGSAAGLNDLVYLERMYAHGASAYLDALAVHAYGFAFPPDAAPAPDHVNFRRVELLREIMCAHGDEEKALYITEAGWNDHPRWTWAVQPVTRITYTLDAYAWAQENWPWCPTVAMWVFRTPRKLHNYQDYFSFVTPDFRERPIYHYVQSALTGAIE
ncbi:MAG: beta-galactosidase [Anaerolineae bacterium]|nr:beta-galactosidase [Anaerolineae bacterium]